MDKFDIVVCGGGSAGFGAALNAARGGAKTILIEQTGGLGGVLTSGCVGYCMDVSTEHTILQDIRKLAIVPKNTMASCFMIDIEEMKYYLEKELGNAGVTIMYHTKITGVQKEQKKITGIYTHSKSGEQLIKGTIFIDCTGDGDVGFFAGCSYEEGLNGKCQPMSFNVVISGLNYEEVKDCVSNNREMYCEDAKANLLQEFQRAGFSPSYPKCTLGLMNGDLFTFSINHQYGAKGTSERDVTLATIKGRDEVFKAVAALRSLGGRWGNIKVVNSPAYIGVREGRRLKGQYTITKEDLMNGAEHKDAICKVKFCVDIHNEDGYTDGGIRTRPYDIPIRSLISAQIDNFFMAGRCISGDFYAHASYRVSGNTFVMGEQIGRYCANIIKKM
mgnify:CR=1 FL=1